MVCPDTALLQNLAVSPGLTLRPSLSAGSVGGPHHESYTNQSGWKPSATQRWRLPENVELVEMPVLPLLVLDILPNRLFILANGGDPVASCPEMLPGEVRPCRPRIVPSNVNPLMNPTV